MMEGRSLISLANIYSAQFCAGRYGSEENRQTLLTKSLHCLYYNKLVYMRKDKQMNKRISNSVQCLKKRKQDG